MMDMDDDLLTAQFFDFAVGTSTCPDCGQQSVVIVATDDEAGIRAIVQIDNLDALDRLIAELNRRRDILKESSDADR